MARSFREPDHLPKQGGRPIELPRQRRGTAPQGRGRYPDQDVLASAGHWDEVTRRVVLARVEDVAPLRFFAVREAAVLRALLDVALGQGEEPRIPVLELIDAKLARGEGDGYRYAEMPEDGETWRRVAAQLHQDDFLAIDRGAYVGRWHDGDLRWERVDAAKAWGVVMRHALAAFYSHPWAWNEIGFGGPAYPRGYMRMGVGDHVGRDPDEAPEAFDADPVRDLG